MNTKELRSLTIAEAHKLMMNKKLSPVELLNACIERLDSTEERLNSYISVYKESAQKVAKAHEDMLMAGHCLGPLHGIPLALKDNISMAGLKTTAGSKVLIDWVPEKDATVTSKLKGAGAVILGKTNMHEFAWGATTDNPHHGVSRNPWDPDKFVAGSSGGSGAAVASGTVLGALGTDTGGSVRLPSCINGIVGMRPTLGRVSNAGIVPLAWTMDTCGPMTRTVEDNAILFNVIAGHDYSDGSCAFEPVTDYTSQLPLGTNKMRLGIIPDIMFKRDQPDVVKAIKEAIKTFESLGVQVVEFSFEHLDSVETATAQIIVEASEPSTYHQKWLREQPENYGDDVRLLLESGEFYKATHYIQAQRYRRLVREEFVKAFREVDFFLTPTLSYTALPVGAYDLVINGVKEDFLDMMMLYTSIPSLTGLPGMNVPCGVDGKNLPIGMQLIGKHFDEVTLYRAGAAFQSVTDFHKKSPALK